MLSRMELRCNTCKPHVYTHPEDTPLLVHIRVVTNIACVACAAVTTQCGIPQRLGSGAEEGQAVCILCCGQLD